MTTPEIYIVLTWHVEGVECYSPVPKLNLEYVDRIDKIFTNETEIKHTLLLQADASIKHASGNSAFLFEKWKPYWLGKQEKGHEIGWHFHPVMCDGLWKQGVHFAQFRESLYEAHRALHCHIPVRSVSTGWCFGCNELMAAYDEIGMEVDASCLAGLHCAGKQPTAYGKTGLLNVFDWQRSHDYPYFPSVQDYQVPGEKSLNILEVPVTTDGLLMLSLNENPRWYRSLLKRTFEFATRKGHPLVIHGYSHSYNMYGGGLENYQSHLANFEQLSKKYGVSLKFLTLSDLRERWLQSGCQYELPRVPKLVRHCGLFYDKISHKLRS